jgi:hypothetical protein
MVEAQALVSAPTTFAQVQSQVAARQGAWTWQLATALGAADAASPTHTETCVKVGDVVPQARAHTQSNRAGAADVALELAPMEDPAAKEEAPLLALPAKEEDAALGEGLADDDPVMPQPWQSPNAAPAALQT